MFVSIIFLILIILLVSCQSPSPVTPAVKQWKVYVPSAPASISSVLEENKIAAKNIGYVLYNIQEKKIVDSLNSDKPFIPASVAKIPTSLFVLESLGRNFRFETSLYFHGTRNQGTWTGDLYLRGEGDPMLMPNDLMKLANNVRRAGLKKLQGRFFVDAEAFPERIEIANDEDEPASYNPSLSALSLDFNRFQLNTVNPKEDANSLYWYTVPAFPWIHFDMDPQLNSRRAQFSWESLDEKWQLPMAQATKGQKDFPIRQGKRATGYMFTQFASLLGMSLPERTEYRRTPYALKPIASHQSYPLEMLIEKGLEFSNNLMTELLFTRAYQNQFNESPDKNVTDKIRSFWSSRVTDTSWKGMQLLNGSGLHAESRLTPLQMLGFLKKSLDYPNYFAMLPISGAKGTLRDRLSFPETAYRVWAKTGTLSYGGGLAGYLFLPNRQNYLFVILLTDFEKRTQWEKKEAQAINVAEVWNKRSKTIQDEIVRSWLLPVDPRSQ